MAVDALAAHHERISKRDEEDLRSLLKEVWGRRFLVKLLQRCHIWEQPWVQGEPDATAFNCGQINIGNQLLREIIEVKPEAYLEMTKMVRKEKEEEENVRRNHEEALEAEESGR